jgi:hypothetical protein
MHTTDLYASWETGTQINCRRLLMMPTVPPPAPPCCTREHIHTHHNLCVCSALMNNWAHFHGCDLSWMTTRTHCFSALLRYKSPPFMNKESWVKRPPWATVVKGYWVAVNYLNCWVHIRTHVWIDHWCDHWWNGRKRLLSGCQFSVLLGTHTCVKPCASECSQWLQVEENSILSKMT